MLGSRYGVIAVAAVTGTVCLPGTAHADMKVVSRVDVSRSAQRGATPTSRTFTVYFKEGKGRLESSGGKAVLLYDYKGRKVYVLNTGQKTYFEKPLPSHGERSALMERLSRFVSVDVDGEIKPIPGQPAQTVAGVPTKPYSLMADAVIQPKQTGGNAPKLQGISVHAQGKFQGAPISALLPKATEDHLLLFTQQFLASANELAQGSLLSDLMRLKVIPLKGIMTVTHTGGGAGGRQRSAEGTGTVAMEVLTLEQHSALEESLFQVPDGYRKVEAPKGRLGSGTNAW